MAEMIEGITLYPGWRVIKSLWLPQQETAPACDIETGEEIKVPTGKQIHVVTMEHAHVMLVSQEAYEKLGML